METQFLLAERPDGSCALFVPLLDGSFRASMQGQGEDGLALVVESGDPAVTGGSVHRAVRSRRSGPLPIPGRQRSNYDGADADRSIAQ